MAEQRVTEADIRAALAGTYTPEGIDTWWTARNENLWFFAPKTLFECGHPRLVLAEAERVAGAM